MGSRGGAHRGGVVDRAVVGVPDVGHLGGLRLRAQRGCVRGWLQPLRHARDN